MRTWLSSGVPLTFINRDSFADPIIIAAFHSIWENGKPDPDDFSELQTVSLLLSLGATAVEKIKKNKLSHDFDVDWFGETVEVETTKASTKSSHIVRTEQANSLSEIIFSHADNFDIHVYVTDLLNESSKKKLLESVSRLELDDDFFSEDGLWQIEAHNITRQVSELFKNDPSRLKPRWWPKGVVNFFTIRQILAGPDSTIAPPQVLFCYAAPFDGYLNPAKKKARRFQGTCSKPFLIAIDVNDLPNSFAAFKEGLRERLPTWKHVSGVLLFYDYISQNEMGWECQMLINKKAHRPMPMEIREKFKEEKPIRIVKVDA